MNQKLPLFDLVAKAQEGDNNSLREILDIFYPYIKQISRQRKVQEQEDVEQEITLVIISKILNYDLYTTYNFSQFAEVITGAPIEYTQFQIEMEDH